MAPQVVLSVTQSPLGKPCPGKEWEETQCPWSSLLHFLLNLLGNRLGFPFRDEDQREFHISREEKWKFKIIIVFGGQSLSPVSFGLCPYQPDSIPYLTGIWNNKDLKRDIKISFSENEREIT